MRNFPWNVSSVGKLSSVSRFNTGTPEPPVPVLSEDRIIENGEDRLTESGEQRVTEGT